MPTKKPDAVPEPLKQLADGLSVHTKIGVRYWIALALVSAVTIMSTGIDTITLPFASVTADADRFYPFAFTLMSLLAVGYASASCEGMRTRALAQKLIDNSEDKFVRPYRIHEQDVLDAIVSPSINRLAPLAQILLGEHQFFEPEPAPPKPLSLRVCLACYFATLRLISMLVVYGLPLYGLAVAFIESDLSSLYASPCGIPVNIFWGIGVLAVVVLLQSLLLDFCYSIRSVKRILGVPSAVPSTTTTGPAQTTPAANEPQKKEPPLKKQREQGGKGDRTSGGSF